MSIRFSDNILHNIEGSGFVVRNRVPRFVQVLVVFLLAFDFICFSAYMIEDAAISGAFLAVLVVSAGFFGCAIWFFMAKFRKLIMATEFQAAMLASATQIGTRFCFITNADGMIYYLDAGFQKIFTSFLNNGSYTLKELFVFTDIPDEARNQMFQALRNHKAGHMVVSFHDSNGDLLTVVVTVDVITRPKGYFIIRGRDYVEKRADSADSENGNKNVLKLLRDAVGHMEGGVVIADHTGKIIAINKAFEQWLGYDAGEVLQSRVPLGQIFHQYVRYDTGILLLSDFEGQVIIKRKSRVTVTAKVHQKLFADAERTYGISAAIDLQHTV